MPARPAALRGSALCAAHKRATSLSPRSFRPCLGPRRATSLWVPMVASRDTFAVSLDLDGSSSPPRPAITSRQEPTARPWSAAAAPRVPRAPSSTSLATPSSLKIQRASGLHPQPSCETGTSPPGTRSGSQTAMRLSPPRVQLDPLDPRVEGRTRIQSAPPTHGIHPDAKMEESASNVLRDRRLNQDRYDASVQRGKTTDCLRINVSRCKHHELPK
jgi:hypothetical protein